MTSGQGHYRFGSLLGRHSMQGTCSLFLWTWGKVFKTARLLIQLYQQRSGLDITFQLAPSQRLLSLFLISLTPACTKFQCCIILFLDLLYRFRMLREKNQILESIKTGWTENITVSPIKKSWKVSQSKLHPKSKCNESRINNRVESLAKTIFFKNLYRSIFIDK